MLAKWSFGGSRANLVSVLAPADGAVEQGAALRGVFLGLRFLMYFI